MQRCHSEVKFLEHPRHGVMIDMQQSLISDILGQHLNMLGSINCALFPGKLIKSHLNSVD